MILRKFREAVYNIDDFYQNQENMQTYLETNTDRDISNSVLEWVSSKEENAFNQMKQVLDIQSNFDDFKTIVEFDSDDIFNMPTRDAVAGYFNSLRVRFTSEMTDVNKMLSISNILIWCTISIQNKASVLTLMNELENMQTDDEDVVLACLWCLFQCSPVLTSAAYLQLYKQDIRKKGIELLLLGKAISSVSFFVSCFLKTKPEYKLHTDLKFKSILKENLLNFFTASFVTYTSFQLCDKEAHAVERNLRAELNKLVEWKGYSNVRSCPVAKLFYEFQALWLCRPYCFERYICELPSGNQESGGSVIGKVMELNNAERKQRDVRLLEKARTHSKDADQQPENDIELVDKKRKKNKYIDDQAKETAIDNSEEEDIDDDAKVAATDNSEEEDIDDDAKVAATDNSEEEDNDFRDSYSSSGEEKHDNGKKRVEDTSSESSLDDSNEEENDVNVKFVKHHDSKKGTGTSKTKGTKDIKRKQEDSPFQKDSKKLKKSQAKQGTQHPVQKMNSKEESAAESTTKSTEETKSTSNEENTRENNKKRTTETEKATGIEEQLKNRIFAPKVSRTNSSNPKENTSSNNVSYIEAAKSKRRKSPRKKS